MEFPTTAVLTLATGVCMEDVFEHTPRLVNFYAGGPVWTHQIPLLFDELRECAVATLGEHYEPLADESQWRAYRDRILDKIGPVMEVTAGKPFHRADAPLADLIEVAGGNMDRIAVVTRP